MSLTLVRAADYAEQAEVTNWPARIGLVVVVLVLIGLALWGMRRGWENRRGRQLWIAEPPEAPTSSAGFSPPVEGLFLGTSTAGDWMDRIVVHDLGVRSRAGVSWSAAGIWLDRVGARSLYIPAGDVVGLRLDRGVAGTVRAKDSVIVVTWRLGDAVLDTGFRADETSGHEAVAAGLSSALGIDVGSRDLQQQHSNGQENGEPGLA